MLQDMVFTSVSSVIVQLVFQMHIITFLCTFKDEQ